MEIIRQELESRVMCLALGAGVGLFSVAYGVSDKLFGESLGGVGMMLWGFAWFLQPPLLWRDISRPISSLFKSPARVAPIGPPQLYLTLMKAGFACGVIGIVLRYVVRV